MRKQLVIVLSKLFLQSSFAQRKNVVNYLDSVSVENNYLTANEKPDVASLNNELDLLDIDQEFLNAAVFWELNLVRKRSNRKELKYSSELYHAGAAFIKRYTKAFFENAMEDQVRLNKPMKDVAKKLNYSKGILRAFVFRFQAIDYDGLHAFYFDAAEENEGLNLFYGNLPSGKEREKEEQTRKAIDNYSYKKFAATFVKKSIAKKINRYLKSKSYSEMACYLVVDPNSIHKNQIPMINCILILSGSRLGMIATK